MDTQSTNAPLPSDLRPPTSALGRQSSVLGPPSSVFRRLSSVLRPLSSVLLPLAAFSVLWIDLIRQLSYQWSTNEQYAYGWFVPFFAAALLWRRWLDRPAPCPPSSVIRHPSSVISDQSSVTSDQSSVISHPQTEGSGLESAPSAFSLQPSALPSVLRPPSSVLAPWPLALCIFLVALLLLPLRVIHEINQDWPLISWPLTVAVVAITLYAVYLTGGWRWVKYFGFPICFILVAVKWPYRIEHSLTQNLMQVVANLTVEVLGWLNVPAVQRGNIIEISTGVVGIDEACSGIRSFQSTLMAALFLGELYLLRWRIRLLLVAVGLAAAFLLNVGRTLLLTWEADKSGLSAIDKWHDPAGLTIAVACFAVLWLIAVIIKRKHDALGQRAEDRGQRAEDRGQRADDRGQKTEDRNQRAEVRSQNVAISDQSSVIRHPSSETVLRPPSSVLCPSRFALRYLLSIGCWALIVIAATEAWYRSHEVRQADTAQWWVNYPTNLPSFHAVAVSKSAQKLLRNDEESGGAWDEPDGTKWSVYCFRWQAGDPTARMSAQGHRPEYCMVGSGHNLVATFGARYLPANGLELPFRLYTFDSAERPLHVFFCLWEDGTETQPGFGQTKYGDRLRSVLAGRRGMGQQTLEIICSGYSSMEEAKKAVQQRLPDIVRTENHTAAPTAGGGR